MSPTFPATQFAAGIPPLLALIARHGLARRLRSALIVLVWSRVSRVAAEVAALSARLADGSLRRHPARRRPRPAPRRGHKAALPRRRGWLIALIPETAACGAPLQALLAAPEMPRLLAAAPQLRRSLRPLCHMLAVPLPPPAPADAPADAPAGAPPDAAADAPAAAPPPRACPAAPPGRACLTGQGAAGLIRPILRPERPPWPRLARTAAADVHPTRHGQA